MSKTNQDTETEELIRRTAKKLFFEEGKFNATTQEIADAAGVNRTLINYYFRSRDKLFQSIFEFAVQHEMEIRHQVMQSDLPFKQKIEKYLDDSIQTAMEYPYLETYIVSKMNEGSLYQLDEDWDSFFKNFDQEFKAEVQKGTVEAMDSIQFIINIASLTSFPLAARPLLQSTFKISNQEYERILKDRKEVILKTLFKK